MNLLHIKIKLIVLVLRCKTLELSKIQSGNSSSVPDSAKNDSFRVNNRKSVILCEFITHNITLFFYATKFGQIFFNLICEIYVIYSYLIYICIFIAREWDKPPIRYP